MSKKAFVVLAMSLMLLFLAGTAISQEKAKEKAVKVQPAGENFVTAMTKAMGERLTTNLQVKHIVGDPLKLGKVTVIPIIMVDFGYGGGGGGQISVSQPVGSGFYMKGEVQPLGFIIISKEGTRFVSVGKAPR